MKFLSQFLMYRVELKEMSVIVKVEKVIRFLMYRVELKGLESAIHFVQKVNVPNVPCGVERPNLFNK